MEEIKIDFPVPSLKKVFLWKQVSFVSAASPKRAPPELVSLSRSLSTLTLAHVTISRAEFSTGSVDVLNTSAAVYFLKSGDRVSQQIWHGSSEGNQSKGICARMCV